MHIQGETGHASLIMIHTSTTKIPPFNNKKMIEGTRRDNTAPYLEVKDNDL